MRALSMRPTRLVIAGKSPRGDETFTLTDAGRAVLATLPPTK
jgi:hypothetical protein